jgi:tripartite-type tricarboxylate transporter receptor subunit TctC
MSGKGTAGRSGPKVAVIGAGSLFFGRQALWQMTHSKILNQGTLAYVDTDGERLDKMMRLAGKVIAEAGVPGYDTGVWWGMLGPGGMPTNLAAKISKDCAEALHAPAVKQRLDNLGAAVVGTTVAEFDKFIRAEYQKWGPIIKAAGIKGS